MRKCPKCGSDKGVYTTFTGTQYYTWLGEPNGYSDDFEGDESVFAKCVSCGKRISMKRILKENKLEN